MPPRGPAVAAAPAVESPVESPVGSLLRTLGPRLRRAERPEDVPQRCPTGLADLDRALGGGVPRGRLTEIAGPLSSGRTSLSLALLAHATAAGETVAWVDAGDALHAESAQAAGLRLERLLWVRAPDGPDALRCSDLLLRAGGFALVVLDLTRRPPVSGPAWLRLARTAASTRTGLVVLCGERMLGSASDLTLALHTPRARFSGTPRLLEGFDVEAALVRNRTGPSHITVPVQLRL